MEVIKVTADTATVRLPLELLLKPGFLLLAPVHDDLRGIAFLVADQISATTGSMASVALSGVTPREIVGPETRLIVEGDGLTEGMTVVIGRSSMPGLRLPTTIVEENVLEAALPPGPIGMADDLFVAVESSDGQLLSTAMPIVSRNVTDSLSELADAYDRLAEDGVSLA